MIIDASERKTTKQYRLQFKTSREDKFWSSQMLAGDFDTSILTLSSTLIT